MVTKSTKKRGLPGDPDSDARVTAIGLEVTPDDWR